MTRFEVILPVAFHLALLSCLGFSERVMISVHVSKKDDGEIGASVYVTNSSRDIFLNSSLSVDINAIMDSSRMLIDAGGFVKETKRNNAVQLTCDATSKDQQIKECQLSKEAEISAKDGEIKNLMVLHEKEINKLSNEKEISAREGYPFSCPKEGEESLSFISGEDEGYEKKIPRENRTQVADILIVDGHYYVDDSEEILKIDPLRKQLCNFWISDDGKLFEGIGWNQTNDYLNGGLGPRSFIIGFIKKDIDTSPSAAAIKIFKELVRTAICSNVLTPHYSLIPMHFIHNWDYLSSESFERKEMSKWVGYRDNVDFLFTSDGHEKGTQPIVSTLEWTDETPSLTISPPIEHLFVENFGTRCFCNCGNYLKQMGDVLKFPNTTTYNFFLAEDGRAYEAMGWEKTDGEELLSVISGDDSWYEEIYVRENRTQVADILIVDGHNFVDDSEEILKIDSFDKQLCNFWISDDGKLFEGIGR
ncbi:hypothetical protein J437_LFUL018580 [Ladona fulva]|uniref:Uncharacterized protein n=1 Tax=Ladona fulva TaxID=123851 RepID=A0A8K0KPW1_LADFU|nr:hypothetical protein J437_LFUL018580 [Ladona fulva]